METHIDEGSPLSNYLEGMFWPIHEGAAIPVDGSIGAPSSFERDERETRERERKRDRRAYFTNDTNSYYEQAQESGKRIGIGRNQRTEIVIFRRL